MINNKPKSPFREFAERCEKTRKKPLSEDAIREINEIAREAELEEIEN